MAAYTAGFMTHVTCRLTAAKNRDQLRNPTLGNQVWATFLPPDCRTYIREVRCRNNVKCVEVLKITSVRTSHERRQSMASRSLP